MNNYKQYIYNEFTTPKINFRKKRKQKQIVNNTTTTPYNSWTNNRLILNNNLWNSFSRPGTCTDGCQPNFQYDNINSPYKWNFNNNEQLKKPHFCELCGLDVTVCRCRGFKSSHFCELCGLDINVCRCRGYKSPCNKCQYDHCICEDPNYEDDYNNNHNNDNNTNEQMCPTCGYYECMCAQLKCGVCHKIVCICDNNDHYELCQCPECQSIPIKDPNNLNNHFNNDQYDHNQHNNGQYENNQYNNDQYNDGQYDNNKYNDNDHYELCQCPECQSIPIKNPNILNNNK